MLVLFETPAGFALFRADKSLARADDVSALFATGEKAAKAVALLAFYKFTDTQDALAAAAAIVESKLGKSMKKFLKKRACLAPPCCRAAPRLRAERCASVLPCILADPPPPPSPPPPPPRAQTSSRRSSPRSWPWRTPSWAA